MNSLKVKKSAQEVLVEKVSELPNLIKLVLPPQADRVIRVEPLKPRVLDLMNGPDSEEWEKIKRAIYLRAPLADRTIDPVYVGTRGEWTLLPEDIPVVKLEGEDLEYLGLNEPNKQPEDSPEPKEQPKPVGRPKKQ